MGIVIAMKLPFSVKSILARPLAKEISRQIYKSSRDGIYVQKKVFRKLLKDARFTVFGRDHHFASISSYEDFKKKVPIRDYEQLKPYIDRIINGERNVLWKEKPIYFAKTSGTTSGTKYIPITKDSISNHINTARNALLCYIAETGNAQFVDGKMIFLSGSPELERVGGIWTGRLSGIVNHHVPGYLRKNQMPSYKTNCIEDWEKKVDQIVDETLKENMSLISGIPPWVQMYFDKLQEKTGKDINSLFPNFSVFVHGGVNYEPYRSKLEASIGKSIDTIETYPASEGFIAFQDSQKEKGLLLNVDSGIFFEFVPAKEIFNENPTRLSLADVKMGENYAIILNTNAGLWGYCIGDTVKFVSKNPYRLVVTGRIKHFISAFGEHVIAEEVEKALLSVANEESVEIIEFSVAPVVENKKGLPHHEWFVEFGKMPNDIDTFAGRVDQELQKQNIYYKDLIDGGVLETLKITLMQKDAFRNYMKSKGKLGGQNKVPRLSDNREIASELEQFVQN